MCKIKVNKIILFFILIIFIIFFIYNKCKHHKMLNIRCYSFQVKKQFYRMKGVRVLTAQSALRVLTEFDVRLFVTAACQNTHACFSLLFICHRRSVRLLFWCLGMHLVTIRPYIYYLDLAMRFLLVPHLPRLVDWQR